MKNLHVLAAFAILSFAIPSVAAMPVVDTQKAVVSTAGLDLSTAKGVRLLDLRITHAASSLCGTPSSSDALGWKKFKSCRDLARAAASEQRQAAVMLASKRRQDDLASTR